MHQKMQECTVQTANNFSNTGVSALQKADAKGGDAHSTSGNHSGRRRHEAQCVSADWCQRRRKKKIYFSQINI